MKHSENTEKMKKKEENKEVLEKEKHVKKEETKEEEGIDKKDRKYYKVGRKRLMVIS